jgi:hypothetical protein
MVIEVTRIGGDGSIRRAVVDTAGRDDAARWERLAQQAALEVPPPYRPEPGQPVYQISAERLPGRPALVPGPGRRAPGGLVPYPRIWNDITCR